MPHNPISKQKYLKLTTNILLSYRTFIIILLFYICSSIWLMSLEGKVLLHRLPYYMLGCIISYIICIVAYKRNATLSRNNIVETKVQKSKLKTVILIGSSILLYCGLAHLLYGAWLKGDDFAFLHQCDIPKRFSIAWQSYLTWVSRSGEFVAHLFALSQNRWEVFLIVPFFIVLTPYFLFKFVSPHSQDLRSLKGICFIFFTVALLLLTPDRNGWRIFYCYAASMNYLIPCSTAILFLSYYNPSRWITKENETKSKRLTNLLTTLFLGMFVCWGGETLSLIVIAFLGAWFASRMKNKQHIDNQCWSGLIGAILGATLLYAAPALSSRSQIDAKSRMLDVFQMSPEAINNFVTSLTWEQVNLLKGGSSVIVLDGIPLWQHIYFLPYLLERYVSNSICAWCVMLLIMLVAFRNKASIGSKHILIIASGLCLSLLGACAYLFSCIPTSMSFAPAAVALICSISYAYWNCNISDKQALWITIIMCAISLHHVIPAGIEGLKYKPYEEMRFQEIARQKAMGKTNIILPAPYPSKPQDKFGLISRADLKETATSYPNNVAASAYHVESISQLPCISVSK